MVKKLSGRYKGEREEEHKGNVSPLAVWNQAEPDISLGSLFFKSVT